MKHEKQGCVLDRETGVEARLAEEGGWLDMAVGWARRRGGIRRLAAGREGKGKHKVRG